MRTFKSQILLRFVNSYIIDSPQPASISYLWNFGSLLATCLVLQILTGIFLAMHYQPHVDFAFNSVEHIPSHLCSLNFAIMLENPYSFWYFNRVKIQKIGQSAGNQQLNN